MIFKNNSVVVLMGTMTMAVILTVSLVVYKDAEYVIHRDNVKSA